MKRRTKVGLVTAGVVGVVSLGVLVNKLISNYSSLKEEASLNAYLIDQLDPNLREGMRGLKYTAKALIMCAPMSEAIIPLYSNPSVETAKEADMVSKEVILEFFIRRNLPYLDRKSITEEYVRCANDIINGFKLVEGYDEYIHLFTENIARRVEVAKCLGDKNMNTDRIRYLLWEGIHGAMHNRAEILQLAEQKYSTEK